MAYKKYITKNGKVYGPYYYESKRIGGKVVSQYHGVKKSPLGKPTKVSEARLNSNLQIPKKILNYAIPLLIFTLILAVAIPKMTFTGHSVIGLEGNYVQGEILKGSLEIKLKQGEFIPANTEVIFENNDQEYNYFLSEITNAQPTTGEYYLESKIIQGEGLGFGDKGKKETYPPVYLKIKSETIGSNSTSSSNLTTEEQIPEENELINQTEEIPISEEKDEINMSNPTAEILNNEEPQLIEETSPEENPIEENKEIKQQTTSTLIEEEVKIQGDPLSEPEPSPMTGSLIKNIGEGIANFFIFLNPTGNVIESSEEIQLELTYEKPYIYPLKENEKISLIPGTVSTGAEKIADLFIKIVEEESKATISTNYKLENAGFGKEFLNEEISSLPINLEELGLELIEGELKIKLIYNETEISSVKTLLKENTTFQISKESKIEEPIEEIPKELRINPLTDEEKIILLEEFGEEKISQTAKEYKDKIIITFSIKHYSVEYSYQKNLDKELLESYIERDKINWLRDITYSLEQKETIEKPLTNLTETKELF